MIKKGNTGNAVVRAKMSGSKIEVVEIAGSTEELVSVIGAAIRKIAEESGDSVASLMSDLAFEMSIRLGFPREAFVRPAEGEP